MVHGVLLVPGFFSFEAFGANGPTPLTYFEQTAPRLEEGGRFVVQPVDVGPTSRLHDRVWTLCERVVDALRHGIRGTRVDRIHLIGHSTGGLDARLLINSKYAGAVLRTRRASDEHADALARIDKVVTISAPMHGTPLAVRFEELFAAFVAILRRLPEPLANALAADDLDRSRWRELATWTTFLELREFLKRVGRNHGLLEDLRPDRMKMLNETYADADAHDRISSFVTVSPPTDPPSLLDGIEPWLKGSIYKIAYERTCDPDFPVRHFPSGPWVPGDARAGASATIPPGANDGVVPCSSQTLDGRATGLIHGDHIDVTGHYASQRFIPITVFRSGAGFDDIRFDALWSAVRNALLA